LLPFVQASLGLPTRQAGWVLAAFPVAALFGNLALGPWIDRYGRRRFIVVGAPACAVLLVMTALADAGGELVLWRAVTGIFMPMVGASVFAAVADYVPAERRVRVIGYVAAAAPVAFLLAMSTGMVVGGLLSWRWPLLLIAAVAAGLALAALRLPPTPATALAAGRPTLDTYRARLLSLSVGVDTRLIFVGYFAWAAAVFAFLGLYPAWAVQRGLAAAGPGAIGAVLFVGECGGLLGALSAGRIAGWSGRPLRLCAAVALATGGVLLTIPLGAGIQWYQAMAYAAFAFGRDLMLALLLGGALAMVPATQRGSLNAIMNALYQAGATLGTLASAWLYAVSPGYYANVIAAAALLLLCSGCTGRIGRVRAA
ncbi:MAG: MFS transporter, partial [Alphaproteobacteria bacterium]